MTKKCFWSALKSKDGFTLVEVMIVLMILGFLAALAFPQFAKVIANSQERADQVNIQIIESAIEVYQIEEGYYPKATNFKDLITELNKAGYIRQSEIKPADSKKKKFTYDSEKHTITCDDISPSPTG